MVKYLYLILFFLIFLIKFDNTADASIKDSNHSLTEISDTYSQYINNDDSETTIDDDDEIKVFKANVFIIIVQSSCTVHPDVKTYNCCLYERIFHYSDSSPPAFCNANFV